VAVLLAMQLEAAQPLFYSSDQYKERKSFMTLRSFHFLGHEAPLVFHYRKAPR
jgi:hypothetical protein